MQYLADEGTVVYSAKDGKDRIRIVALSEKLLLIKKN